MSVRLLSDETRETSSASVLFSDSLHHSFLRKVKGPLFGPRRQDWAAHSTTIKRMGKRVPWGCRRVPARPPTTATLLAAPHAHRLVRTRRKCAHGGWAASAAVGHSPFAIQSLPLLPGCAGRGGRKGKKM
jgi:hypothetical protein